MPATKHPVVFIHGAMGWGKTSPLFNSLPSYWPKGALDELNPNHIIVDVGKVSSDHDRACEAFYQLFGGTVDYGEAHAAACGHLRFGATYSKAMALHPNWSEHNPVHLTGHSLGATTAIELYQLLCKDAFHVGSNHKWVKGIVSICGPLTGSTLGNLLGGDVEKGLSYCSAGYVVGTALTVLWKCQEFYAPWLKSVYDLGMPQWTRHPSWSWVFSRANDMYTSRDLAFYDILPAARLRKNEMLIDMDKVHLLSIATKATDTGHSLSVLSYLLHAFTRGLDADALYDGFESDHWAHNDGVVNTVSMRYPRSDSDDSDDSGSVTDLEASRGMVQGKWYTRLIEGKNHLCGTHWDNTAAALYQDVFAQIVSWET